MKEISYGEDYKFIPATSIGSGVGMTVLPDVYMYTIQIVNIVFIGHPNSKEYVLVDTGMPRSAEKIIEVAEERFGKNNKPQAILLTHGHFDHVGAIVDLIHYWNVPVYAHELELPYLTGVRSYPEPDPTVEGGMVAKMSPLFPNEPINLSNLVQALPKDGSVPFLPHFRWIHTPGHTEGHVSFFRHEDGLLIVGDAFVTVKQEYLYKVFTQELEISGPPKYLTPDWEKAEESVKKLAQLKPKIAITGHGLPMSGYELAVSLNRLADNFKKIAVPKYGKYVNKKLH